MKVQFGDKEKLIIRGFLSMAQAAAIDDENDDMTKSINKLIYKFTGDSAYISIKKDYLFSIKDIVDHVLNNTELKNDEDDRPGMSQEDFDTCKSISEKIENYLC